jgi:hypothetical protein
MSLKSTLIITVISWFMVGLEIGFLKNYLFSEFVFENIWYYLSVIISLFASVFLTRYLDMLIKFEIKKKIYKSY